MFEDFERMQMRAWPAEHEQWLGSWKMRFSRGFSNRSNSVTPLGGVATTTDEGLLAAAEAAYREIPIAPCFRLRDDDECVALDRALETRGYGVIHPTRVQTVKLPCARERLAQSIVWRPPLGVDATDGFREPWVKTYATLNQRPREWEDYWRTLGAVRVPVRTMILVLDGAAIAAGSAIYDSSADPERAGAWVGFYDLAVAPSWRGRGVGKLLLEGLVVDSLERGADRGYLAVMEKNAAALRLYARAGFEDLYRYWYRKAADAQSVDPPATANGTRS